MSTFDYSKTLKRKSVSIIQSVIFQCFLLATLPTSFIVMVGYSVAAKRYDIFRCGVISDFPGNHEVPGVLAVNEGGGRSQKSY